jgi:hypothetical protein
MRSGLAVATLIAAAAAYAQVPGSSSCLPGVTPAPPTFPLISTVGIVSDYTLFCTNTGFVGGPVASLNFDFFMNVSPELNTGSWTLTQGVNTYSGTFIPGNLVSFTGVTYNTNIPTLSFEIHGVEVNPSMWGPSFVYLETVTISGPLTVHLPVDPIETVAFNANSPEPSTMPLAGMALGVLLVARRRRALPPLPHSPTL